MLYFESRQGRQEGFRPLIAIFVMFSLLILWNACSEEHDNRNKDLTLDAFEALKAEEYALNSQTIQESLEHIWHSDKDSTTADYRVRNYYRNGGHMVWIDRYGVDERADTLLNVLRETVSDMGFTERSFAIPQISEDLDRMRTLTFDGENDVNHVLARLEYNLTKAYVRYAMGQRYGFVNPYNMLNRLDPSKTDTLGRPLDYQLLFDVEMDIPDKHYLEYALRMVSVDSLSVYLHDIQPLDNLYQRYKSMLPQASGAQRMRLLCNMDRRRWRVKSHPDPKGKYVLVNVAAYHLWAVSPDTVIDMRVGCGASRTKTPLLTSYITHMNVNPEWVIPMSIIRNDIAHHAGNPSYFSRRGYYIADRKTGSRLDASKVTSDQLLSGQLKVAQNGGAGNSLGRIIFRFPNKFSVFLHDTSTRGFFSAENRGVSHGCVRVQKPFELARFLLKDPDEWVLDKLRISMGIPPETERGKGYMEREDRPEHPRLVDFLSVSPRVPLYITYYTLYPDPAGQLQTYPDVYGYDKAMERTLKQYLQ